MKRWLIIIIVWWSAVCVHAKVAVPERNYHLAWQQYQLKDSTKTPRQQFPFQSCFETAAQQHQVPLSLLLALARGESDFNANAKSSANAYGVMQILWPSTAEYLGIDSLPKLLEPCTNIEAGTRYIKELIERFDGDLHLALAAYNYGPARIDRNRDAIPDGANWYSGYIYSHLQYVLNSAQSDAIFNAPQDYRQEQKLDMTSFTSVQRSLAFVAAIRQRIPKIRLDTFDYGLGRFHVVLLYSSDKELNAAKYALRQAGFFIR
jgi:soluble lytic murein transglycosylase-like protein